jgi:flagellar biosynthesis protein FlhA
MQLKSTEYRIKIRGSVIAQGQTKPDKLLAMDSGLATGRIDGEPTREPAFGLDAVWIEPAMKVRAETMNYTVVDPTSVVATHLTEVVKQHAAELLTREEVANLLEAVKQKSPKLIEETVPTVIKTGELQKILQNLLRERVPIRDLESILETVADWGTKTKDLDVLTEYVRNALRRAICQIYAAPSDAGRSRIVCVTLDPALEDTINGYVDRSASGTIVSMPARIATEIAGLIGGALRQVTNAGHLPVVIASPQVRAVVRQIIEPHIPTIAVLGYNEIVPGIDVESLALVSAPPRKDSAVAA